MASSHWQAIPPAGHRVDADGVAGFGFVAGFERVDKKLFQNGVVGSPDGKGDALGSECCPTGLPSKARWHTHRSSSITQQFTVLTLWQYSDLSRRQQQFLSSAAEYTGVFLTAIATSAATNVISQAYTKLTQFRTHHPDFFSFVKDGVDGLVAIGTVGKTESKKATKFQKKERRRRRSALKFQMIYSIAIPYFMRL